MRRSFRFLARRAKAGSQEGYADADNVLMQISLAFTIILGYLLETNLMAQARLTTKLRDTASQIRRDKETIDELRGALKGVAETPQGRFAVLHAESEEELQKMRLLNAWNQIRPDRVLPKRLDTLILL